LKETATYLPKAKFQTAISKFQSFAKFFGKLSQGTIWKSDVPHKRKTRKRNYFFTY
jgi:hypothetical protein